jgi:hypothetical protein
LLRALLLVILVLDFLFPSLLLLDILHLLVFDILVLDILVLESFVLDSLVLDFLFPSLLLLITLLLSSSTHLRTPCHHSLAVFWSSDRAHLHNHFAFTFHQLILLVILVLDLLLLYILHLLVLDILVLHLLVFHHLLVLDSLVLDSLVLDSLVLDSCLPCCRLASTNCRLLAPQFFKHVHYRRSSTLVRKGEESIADDLEPGLYRPKDARKLEGCHRLQAPQGGVETE